MAAKPRIERLADDRLYSKLVNMGRKSTLINACHSLSNI